jgi:hypothetical protein
MVLRQILLHAPAYPMPEPKLLVTDARERFDENGELFNEQTRKRMQRFIESLVEWTERFRKAVAAHDSSDLDAMIEEERKRMRGDPDQEAKVWLEKLTEVDQERRAYQRLAAKGRMTNDELDGELAELAETRKIAERELEALRSRRERIEDMERDRDALLDNYAHMAPEALNVLAPEERHPVYRILRLQAAIMMDGTLDISGTFGEGDVLCPTTTPS